MSVTIVTVIRRFVIQQRQDDQSRERESESSDPPSAAASSYSAAPLGLNGTRVRRESKDRLIRSLGFASTS